MKRSKALRFLPSPPRPREPLACAGGKAGSAGCAGLGQGRVMLQLPEPPAGSPALGKLRRARRGWDGTRPAGATDTERDRGETQVGREEIRRVLLSLCFVASIVSTICI